MANIRPVAHPLIHLGYAYELQSKTVAIEALSLGACFYSSLHKYIDEEGKKGEVKFAEVKSENDRLSDTQRLWIHVLSGAGITVELCAAVATEVIKR